MKKKIYVWATDKFTSSLHSFAGLKDKFVVVCDNWGQADVVEEWMRKEKVYSYINHGYELPRFSKKYYVCIKNYNECYAFKR